MRVGVTTGRDARQQDHERAALLAARFSAFVRPGFPAIEATAVRRAGFETLVAAHGFDCFYIVGRRFDAVRGASSKDDLTYVQPALLRPKLGGSSHEARHQPFVRAVRGQTYAGSRYHPDVDVDADADTPTCVFDATLGLAGDALHLAAVLATVHADVRLEGAEGSPLMHALLEEGLPRLRADPWPELADAAARIHLPDTAVDNTAALAARPDDAVDVVVVDPMMPRPLHAPPTFSMVRHIAVHEPPSAAFWREARRVARRRVVVKLVGDPRRGLDPEQDRGPRVAPGCPLVFGHVVHGTRVDYLVHTPDIDGVIDPGTFDALAAADDNHRWRPHRPFLP